jgi:hypothetical protein
MEADLLADQIRDEVSGVYRTRPNYPHWQMENVILFIQHTNITSNMKYHLTSQLTDPKIWARIIGMAGKLDYVGHALVMLRQKCDGLSFISGWGGRYDTYRRIPHTIDGCSDITVQSRARKTLNTIHNYNKDCPDIAKEEIAKRIGKLALDLSKEDKMCIQQSGKMTGRAMNEGNRFIYHLTGINISSSSTTLAALTKSKNDGL